jgi:hypothetical protein
VLYFLCEETDPGVSTRTPRERMRSLGSGLEEIAGLSRAGFEAILLERRLRLLSRSIVYLEASLKQFGSTPAWWVRDIQRFVRSFEEEMAGPDILRFSEPGTSPPEDPLGTYQNYARWCGRLLREWPGMREAAMRLRH